MLLVCHMILEDCIVKEPCNLTGGFYKLHDFLIMWSSEITWQTKNITSQSLKAKLVAISDHPAKFSGYRDRGSEDIMVLVCWVILETCSKSHVTLWLGAPL